jgi:hypothetical protein
VRAERATYLPRVIGRRVVRRSRRAAVLASQPVSTTSVLISALAGLVGAGIGGFVVALISRSTERDKQFRERMLVAADDFLESWTNLSIQLEALAPHEPAIPGVVISGISGQSVDSSTLDANEERLQLARDEVRRTARQLARVRLIYDPRSLAASAAERACAGLAEAVAQLHVYFEVLALEAVKADERSATDEAPRSGTEDRWSRSWDFQRTWDIAQSVATASVAAGTVAGVGFGAALAALPALFSALPSMKADQLKRHKELALER